MEERTAITSTKLQNGHGEKGLFQHRAQKCRWKREKKEQKCGCRAAYVYRMRENKRIMKDKQEMKGMGRIRQQLEAMQMVLGSNPHCVRGAAQDMACVCLRRGSTTCWRAPVENKHRVHFSVCVRKVSCVRSGPKNPASLLPGLETLHGSSLNQGQRWL